MRFRFLAAPADRSEPEPDSVRLRNALLRSTALHAGIVVALLVGAWWLGRVPDDPPVFTLVAVPDQSAPPDAAAESSPDFLSAMRQRQRAEERRAQREIAQDRRREERARAAAEAAAAAEQRAAAQAPPRVVAPAPPRSTTSPAADSSALDAYFSSLFARLRENHEAPDGLSDQLSAEVRFTLGADGSVSGVRIIRGSGNAAFDQSVLDAFSRLRMPPRPDRKTDEVRLTFRIREL